MTNEPLPQRDPIARRAQRTVLEHVAYALEREMPMAPTEPIILDQDVRVHRLSFPGHEELYVRTTVDVLTRDQFNAYVQEQMEVEAFRREQAAQPKDVDQAPPQSMLWGPWGAEGRPGN